jgi:hypothetical protein
VKMAGDQALQLIEAQYQSALRRLAFRLALIVSIAVMAQFISNWIGG